MWYGGAHGNRTDRHPCIAGGADIEGGVMVPMPSTYAPYTDTRRVELSFTFGVIAPDAAALGHPSSSAQSVVSQIAQTTDEVEEMSGNYTSLELNMWTLDGSRQLYPGAQVGWNSADLSGDDGAYTTPPWLEFSFPSNQDSYGFTLIFDNTQPDNYPSQVLTETWDENGDPIGSKTTSPDGYFHIINLPTQNYRRVRFTFNGSSVPHRRVRVMRRPVRHQIRLRRRQHIRRGSPAVCLTMG